MNKRLEQIVMEHDNTGCLREDIIDLLDQQRALVVKEIFTEEELKVMLIDYEGLMRVSGIFTRTVVGNDALKDQLTDHDITGMKILKKLRKKLDSLTSSVTEKKD